MRVIGGTCRGMKLEAPPGRSVRPVRDAVREALFNILGDWITGKKVLDLYAGTGSLGIEALSRGARGAVFLENDPETVSVLRGNLERTRLSPTGSVVTEDVLSFLSRAGVSENRKGFHAVFVDPPFAFSGSPNLRRLVDGLGPGPLWGSGELIAVVEVEAKSAQLTTLRDLPGEVEFRTYGRNLLCIAHHAGVE
ncbi:MAG: 16S rRNA (guanine(966)-N(2))-methyltransferase RsmD [Planctomycetota bacterium]|jgi:16S rRNA (guanine966-N2)-methyltransferase